MVNLHKFGCNFLSLRKHSKPTHCKTTWETRPKCFHLPRLPVGVGADEYTCTRLLDDLQGGHGQCEGFPRPKRSINQERGHLAGPGCMPSDEGEGLILLLVASLQHRPTRLRDGAGSHIRQDQPFIQQPVCSMMPLPEWQNVNLELDLHLERRSSFQTQLKAAAFGQ